MIETAGAILRKDGLILLGLRAGHRSYADRWDIIGGHLEEGETPWQALCRELREEIGITAIAGEPLATLTIASPPSRLHVFTVTTWRGDPGICDDEHCALRWFAPCDASALTNLAMAEYSDLFAALD